MMIRQMSVAVLVAVVALSGLAGHASADMSKSVMNAFKGQLVISKDELPEGKNDKDTIAKIKAARLAGLEGTDQDEVQYWSFHYTAFLSKTGATTLELEFYNGKQLSANKRLTGVDPKSKVLSGDISINEDEGLTKGKTYTIKLLNGKTTVSTATLMMK